MLCQKAKGKATCPFWPSSWKSAVQTKPQHENFYHLMCHDHWLMMICFVFHLIMNTVSDHQYPSHWQVIISINWSETEFGFAQINKQLYHKCSCLVAMSNTTVYLLWRKRWPVGMWTFPPQKIKVTMNGDKCQRILSLDCLLPSLQGQNWDLQSAHAQESSSWIHACLQETLTFSFASVILGSVGVCMCMVWCECVNVCGVSVCGACLYMYVCVCECVGLVWVCVWCVCVYLLVGGCVWESSSWHFILAPWS